MKLIDAEALIRSDLRINPVPLHDEKYELTFEGPHGRQIAINRRASKTAVRVWIENTVDPRSLGLSADVKIDSYPRARPRAHLSASRLTGPYKNRQGNDAWYLALTSPYDLLKLLDGYFK